MDFGLADNLAPPGKAPHIGDERIVLDPHTGIGLYISPHGSYRYVFKINGEAVSGLQLVARNRRVAFVAQVFTADNYRRLGYASRLLNKAREDFKTVNPATDLSDDGKAWTAKHFPK